MTGRITNAVLNQKLDDLIGRTERIDSKVSITNGKVADAHIKIAELAVLQKTCPARTNTVDGVTRNWTQFTFNAIVALGIFIISILQWKRG